jgi:hypothetical protein
MTVEYHLFLTGLVCGVDGKWKMESGKEEWKLGNRDKGGDF